MKAFPLHAKLERSYPLKKSKKEKRMYPFYLGIDLHLSADRRDEDPPVRRRLGLDEVPNLSRSRTGSFSSW